MDSLFSSRIHKPTLSKYGDRAKDKATMIGRIIVYLTRNKILSNFFFNQYKRGNLDRFFISSSTATALVLWYHEEMREFKSSLTYDELLDIRWLTNNVRLNCNIELPLPSDIQNSMITRPVLAQDRWYLKQLIRRRPLFINQINYLTNEQRS